mmetsp:Transcript_45022/g.95723  ORF Transcript_45022/g.95723 Transcript_45022/m.95723 type:complete len:329 (+) Transcript_45022:615-1601(+)
MLRRNKSLESMAHMTRVKLSRAGRTRKCYMRGTLKTFSALTERALRRTFVHSFSSRFLSSAQQQCRRTRDWSMPVLLVLCCPLLLILRPIWRCGWRRLSPWPTLPRTPMYMRAHSMGNMVKRPLRCSSSFCEQKFLNCGVKGSVHFHAWPLLTRGKIAKAAQAESRSHYCACSYKARSRPCTQSKIQRISMRRSPFMRHARCPFFRMHQSTNGRLWSTAASQSCTHWRVSLMQMCRRKLPTSLPTSQRPYTRHSSGFATAAHCSSCCISLYRNIARCRPPRHARWRISRRTSTTNQRCAQLVLRPLCSSFTTIPPPTSSGKPNARSRT